MTKLKPGKIYFLSLTDPEEVSAVVSRLTQNDIPIEYWPEIGHSNYDGSGYGRTGAQINKKMVEIVNGYYANQYGNKGLPLLIVSNSDHAFNALRVMIRKENIPLDKIEFIFADLNEISPNDFRIQYLIPHAGGTFEYWPSGWFDQYEIDLCELF